MRDINTLNTVSLKIAQAMWNVIYDVSQGYFLEDQGVKVLDSLISVSVEIGLLSEVKERLTEEVDHFLEFSASYEGYKKTENTIKKYGDYVSNFQPGE